MLKFLRRDEWLVKITNQRKLFFNEQSVVIEALKAKHKCTAEYIVFEKRDSVVISFLALVKGKQIIAPIHFFYSALWVESTLGDTKYCEYVVDFLRALRLTFTKIEIRIPPAIPDVRPFIWANFSIKNRFTYVKNLDKLEYAKDVHKNIAKAASVPYVYKEEAITAEILSINLQIFYDLKLYSKKSVKEIGKLIAQLSDTEYLTCFSCYLENELLVSHIVFIDEENKIAYTVLKNKLYQKQAGSLHSALYHHLFVYLKSKGFEYVDLLGADMEFISLFKSRFKAKLCMANVAKYNNVTLFLGSIQQKIKYLIKRVIAIVG